MLAVLVDEVPRLFCVEPLQAAKYPVSRWDTFLCDDRKAERKRDYTHTKILKRYRLHQKCRS